MSLGSTKGNAVFFKPYTWPATTGLADQAIAPGGFVSLGTIPNIIPDVTSTLFTMFAIGVVPADGFWRIVNFRASLSPAATITTTPLQGSIMVHSSLNSPLTQNVVDLFYELQPGTTYTLDLQVQTSGVGMNINRAGNYSRAHALLFPS